MKRINLSYSNVVATIALLVAISGGATAIAISAGKNTVTTKSIKPGNVTARDLGPIKTVIQQTAIPDSSGSSNDSKIIRLFCPKGSRPLSGGAAGAQVIQSSYPTPNGWQMGLAADAPTGGSIPVVGYVVCLSGSPGKPRNEF